MFGKKEMIFFFNVTVDLRELTNVVYYLYVNESYKVR